MAYPANVLLYFSGPTRARGYATNKTTTDRQTLPVDEFTDPEVLAFRQQFDDRSPLDLKHRGLSVAPKIAVGDGTLGFWAALRKVFPDTREQRCWVHKTANVLNNMPKSVQPREKADIHEIWMAENREQARKAFDNFLEKYGAKCEKAVECLRKDRDVLLTFYDFPAEH